jgi:hypothetical protein
MTIDQNHRHGETPRRGNGRAFGYTYGEAFCLMLYRCRGCGALEILWNNRDGVTPFSINCRREACNTVDGLGCPMVHEEWRLDSCLPTFQPWPGMRIFRDGTPDEARAFMRRRLERSKGTEWEVTDPAEAEAIIESAATDPNGEFRPGWPMIDTISDTALGTSLRELYQILVNGMSADYDDMTAALGRARAILAAPRG